MRTVVGFSWFLAEICALVSQLASHRPSDASARSDRSSRRTERCGSPSSSSYTPSRVLLWYRYRV